MKMGMSGCYLVMKLLLVSLNFVFLVAGWAVSGVSVWFLLDPTQMSAGAAAGSARYQLGLYVLLAAGLLLTVVAVVGLCGALRDSQCCLSAFFCLLTLCVVGEAAAAWWGAAHTGQLRAQLSEYMKNTVANEYGQAELVTASFDTFQRELQCCGAEGPSDYLASKYGSQGDGARGVLDLSVISRMKEYLVPASCCVRAVSVEECTSARSVHLTAAVDSTHLYKKGCVEAVVALAQRYAPIVAGVAVAVLGLQVLALLLSVCLCLNSSGAERYKA